MSIEVENSQVGKWKI